VPLYRVAPKDQSPAGVVPLCKDAEKGKGDEDNADVILGEQWRCGDHAGRHLRMLKAKWSKCVFGHELCDLLVLDEASQMSLPEAIMAALP